MTTPPAAGSRVVRTWEMGITRSEFERLLAAVRPEPGLSWRVDATERAPRHLGLITMPVLHVTLEIDGSPRAAVDRFVERFLLVFQRAGG